MNIKTNMIKNKHKTISLIQDFVKPHLMTNTWQNYIYIKKNYILGFGLLLSRNLCQLSILHVQKLIKKKKKKKKKQRQINYRYHFRQGYFTRKGYQEETIWKYSKDFNFLERIVWLAISTTFGNSDEIEETPRDEIKEPPLI